MGSLFVKLSDFYGISVLFLPKKKGFLLILPLSVLHYIHSDANIAQSVERFTRNEQVLGSIPSVGSIFFALILSELRSFWLSPAFSDFFPSFCMVFEGENGPIVK